MKITQAPKSPGSGRTFVDAIEKDGLGPLGFFHLSHLPDGGDYADSQNLGLLDQIMALK